MGLLTNESDTSSLIDTRHRAFRKLEEHELGEAAHIKRHNSRLFSPKGEFYTEQRDRARAVIEWNVGSVVLRSAEFEPLKKPHPVSAHLGRSTAIRNVAAVQPIIEGENVVGHEYRNSFAKHDRVIFYDGVVYRMVGNKKYGDKPISDTVLRAVNGPVQIFPSSILMIVELNRDSKRFNIVSGAFGEEIDTLYVQHCFSWLEYSGFTPCPYHLSLDKHHGEVIVSM